MASSTVSFLVNEIRGLKKQEHHHATSAHNYEKQAKEQRELESKFRRDREALLEDLQKIDPDTYATYSEAP